jgi:hypothetical protein
MCFLMGHVDLTKTSTVFLRVEHRNERISISGWWMVSGTNTLHEWKNLTNTNNLFRQTILENRFKVLSTGYQVLVCRCTVIVFVWTEKTQSYNGNKVRSDRRLTVYNHIQPYMGTLVTGQQDTPALCPANRVFFWREIFFWKKCVPICLFLSRCRHTWGILWFNVFHQRKILIMTKTKSLPSCVPRWYRVSSKLSLNTRFVCVWTSFSTNVWWILFLLLEWIHPSIDQQCSHTDDEHMTPETLYANQTSSLNMGSPVLL